MGGSGFDIMATRHFLMRTARGGRPLWFRLRLVVLQAGYSDLTPTGPAGVCECVFVAGESGNPPDLDRVPPGFSGRVCTPWAGHTRAAAHTVSRVCPSAC